MERLDADQQRLAEEAVSRAEAIKRRYERLFPQHAEDIESSACWGLVRAASGWDANGGQTWERWSNLLIRGEIVSYLRSPHVQYHNSEWFANNEKTLTSKSSPMESAEKSEEVERLLAMLPERTAQLMRLVYFAGMPPSKAGPAIGVSPKHGCKLHQKALAYLRKHAA